ncbi:MAG: protein translocase subunit SecDF [Bacteroidota bacterium]
MQGKGVVRFFLVVMTIVTLVQYFFMLPTQKVETAADEYAETLASQAAEEQQKTVFKEKRSEFLDSMSTEEVFKIPYLKSYTYQDLKAQQLALGLDLKGGMSVVLQVDLREFIRALANSSKDPTFLAALNEATEAQKNAQADYVTLFADAFRSNSEGKKLAPIFARNEALREKINFETSDGEVVRLIREKANETVDLTYKLLKERIDKLGVTQPNVSLDASRDLITVELPGIDNPERARQFLQAAAKLEFWNVYRISDSGLVTAFAEANERLSKELGASVEPEITRIDTLYKQDSLGNDLLDQIVAIDTVYNEFNANAGPLFDVFQLNQTGARGLAVMGTARKNQRSIVEGYLNQENIKGLFPRDLVFRWSKDPIRDLETGDLTDDYELYAIKKERGSEKPPLTGDRVVDANASPDPQTNEVGVSLKMDNAGAKIWGQMTTKAGQDNNREIAILLDNEVVSAPRVINPILTGDSQISGSFSIQEAKDLSNILQVGKLPAETRIIQESLVGPSLGQKNIDRSLNSLIIGFLLLLGFMVFYYGGGGIVAIIVLFLNLFFIFGALASYGTVLTLPGVAGIILTVGMAVDANVIIYERIREELRDGKSLAASIADGFQNSYSAIIDANVTTILTAFVLAYFGLGPIKGFAVVLIIGVLSSLFTAVLVGRLIIDWWVGRGNNLSFWTGFSKNLFADLQIDWLGRRKLAYIISGTIIVLGIASFAMRGFELGVDFKGGYSYNITFDKNASIDADDLRESLTTTFGSTPTVKAVDTENTFNVVTDYQVDNTDDDAPNLVMEKLYEGVNTMSGGNLDFNNFKSPDGEGTYVSSSSKVGPTIADDIKNSAFYATIFALLLIFLYIFIRFSKWQYSAGAVAALFHDTMIVLAVFSIGHGILPFSLEIDQAFIAAILTVIGYSINDTVVVFDRIREFMGLYTKKSKEEVINMAINSTVSRTVITSLTTLLMVAILFVFGGASIKGFAFALLVGIIVGTYSSVFVATPVMSDLTGDLKPVSTSKKDNNKKGFSKAIEKAK